METVLRSSGSEARGEVRNRFLDQLKADLSRASAIVLANFYTTSRSRQVDFLVVTGNHVCHVELKNYPPI